MGTTLEKIKQTGVKLGVLKQEEKFLNLVKDYGLHQNTEITF
jgi:hypothetical protein